jgi:hypothetical protein
MDDEKSLESDSNESAKVRINFRIPSKMPALYAHHMVVQSGEHEVTISFFEVIQPPILEKDQLKLLEETGVSAECIARIAIAKSRFPEFVEVMKQALSRMSAQKEVGMEQANADTSKHNQQGQ